MMDKAGGEVEVCWTKAHVEVEDVLEKGIREKEIVGNECADALAKRGAKLVELDMNAVGKIQWADRVSILIRDRLLFIQRHIITQQPGGGREEEEKKRKKANYTSAKR